MQLLAPAVDPIAPDRAVNRLAAVTIEFPPKPTEVYVRFAHVLQFACDEFEHDDIVEVTDDGDMIRQYIFRVAEIDEYRKQPFAFGFWQLPLVVEQHFYQGFDLRQTMRDKIRQWFLAADILQDIAKCLDDLGFLCITYCVTRLPQRILKVLQVAIAEFE